MDSAWPTMLVIGAMKCGTTAVHECLRRHPQVSMARCKEVDFFVGPADPRQAEAGGGAGRWHRGPDWYRSLFDPGCPVRGESSPGYTSPDHPEVAGRIAEQLPAVRLVYLVRDPVERALSQYAHHRRDGDEARPPEEALLDPASQYLSRSRYLRRLEPFLERFDPDRILVVVQERLHAHPRAELNRVFAHIGADPWWHPDLGGRWNAGGPRPEVSQQLRDDVGAGVAADLEDLRRFLRDPIPEWSL